MGSFTKAEPGGLIEGGEALFIAQPPPHVAPHRGGERGLKDGGGRTKSQLCNRLGRAHLLRSGSRRRVHLCTRRSRRGHLWPMRGKANAGMTWPMWASLGRTQGGRCACDVADAGILWMRGRRPTRVSFHARMTWRRGHLLELVSRRASF